MDYTLLALHVETECSLPGLAAESLVKCSIMFFHLSWDLNKVVVLRLSNTRGQPAS